MNKEKQIEEMAEVLRHSCENECFKNKDGFNDCEACEACLLYEHGYRKQSEGEWIFETNHYFNDYGDLKVYATAKCSECEKPYPFNPSEFVERPETLSAYEDWDIDVEPIKAAVLERAKSNKSLYPFCPNCGAKMKGV